MKAILKTLFWIITVSVFFTVTFTVGVVAIDILYFLNGGHHSGYGRHSETGGLILVVISMGLGSFVASIVGDWLREVWNLK